LAEEKRRKLDPTTDDEWFKLGNMRKTGKKQKLPTIQDPKLKKTWKKT